MTRAHEGPEGRAGEIEQAAAEWVTRIDLHGSPEDWAALDAWLAASPRHRAAFLRLSVAWRRTDVLRKLAPPSGEVDEDLFHPARWKEDPSDDEVLEGRVISFQSHSPEHRSRNDADRAWEGARSYRAGSEAPAAQLSAAEETGSFKSFPTSRLAASIAIATVIGGALAAWYGFDQSRGDVYSTQVGEFHRVTLDDGSTVALNTDSEVQVRYTASARHVDLVRGEALFEVAKNKERPFDVAAGDTTVRAVGTEFSVRLHEETTAERVDVVVSEGRIAINPPSEPTYPAGTVAIVRNGRVEATTLSSEDITGRLAWTQGKLVLQGEKLSDIVAELNRYNQRKLVITDPEIANTRVGGTFRTTDPASFARALNRTFGIQSHPVSSAFGKDVIRLDSGVP